MAKPTPWQDAHELRCAHSHPCSASSAAVAAVAGKFDTKPSGFIGGGQIGYNYQMGPAVWGVEADFSGADSGVRRRVREVLGSSISICEHNRNPATVLVWKI